MTLLLILPITIIYVFFRAFFPFLESKLAKFIAFLVIVLFAFSFPIGMATRHFFDIKGLFIIRFTSVVFGTYAFTLMFLLLRDILAVTSFITHVTIGKLKKLHKYMRSYKSVLASFLLAISVAFVGLYNATRIPEVREVAVTIPNLPEDLKGFKIAQLTDTHIGAGFDSKWLAQVVEITNSLKADIILGTGDIIDDNINDVGHDADVLTKLSAKYGVYFITGNHEYYAGANEWLDYFENTLGLSFLVNESVVLEVGESKLVVSGLPDLNYYRGNNTEPRNHEKMLKDIPQDSIKILMDHQPKEAKKNAEYGFDLQLSGHTHGGQVALIQPLVAYMNNGYVVDLYKVDDMSLYVSRGTGLWGFASLRLFVPSEITLMTLQ